MWVISPVMGFSESTRTPTSIDVLKAEFTIARIFTTWPSLTGLKKWRASIEAVTTVRLAWRVAAIAAAISIQLMIFPPKIVPKAFVSEGNTISVICTADSLENFPVGAGIGVFAIIGLMIGQFVLVFKI